MTVRLAEVEARIAGAAQIGTVVGALRGVAAARVQQARGAAEGVRAYTAVVGQALAEAVALLPVAGAAPLRRGRGVLIIFTAEHGFVGALPERMLEEAEPYAGAGALLYCLGARGVALAEARGWKLAWTSPMAAQIGAATSIASEVAERLYAEFLRGAVTSVEVLHPCAASDGRVATERRRLLPLDLVRFRRPTGAAEPPLVQLPPARLAEMLVGEYFLAELARATLEAFAAENAARLQTMQSARSNIDRRLDELRGEEGRARQEAITGELLDVLAGTLADGVSSTWEPPAPARATATGGG